MNNLTQISEIFAGLLNVYIVKSTDLTFDDIINGELQGINLNSGVNYTQIPFTVGTSDFQSKSNINKIAFHDNSIELILSGNDLDQVQEFASMDGNTYILLFEDRLNRFWVSGTPDLPLRFSDKYSTGKAMQGLSGRKIVFESDSNITILQTPKPIELEFGNPAFYVNQESVTFEFSSQLPTQSGTLIARTSDNVEHSVYLDNISGFQDLVINNIPSDGLIEFISGLEFVKRIRIETNQGLQTIQGLSGFYNLFDLWIRNNVDFAHLDLTNCNLLFVVVASYNNISSVVLPQSNIMNFLDLQTNPLSVIDLSPVPKLLDLTLRPEFSDIDLSPLDLEGTADITLLANDGFNQTVIDKIISDILAAVTISGQAGDLSLQGSTAPSAQGLADISTLEVTYGWTVIHD